MPSDKMKDGNDGDNKCHDPGSALGYRLMIYMIIAVILVAISITILMSWMSNNAILFLGLFDESRRSREI